MKKLWFNIMIFFGCFLLLVTTLGAVLIIAPGMELLGIMYIRSTSGSVDESKSVPNAHRYTTIQVESSNIPVYIEFVQSYSLDVNLVENYNGFAKAGEAPSLEVSTTEGVLYIKSSEYEPFLGYSRDEESGLFVKVPMYYENNIVVNSNKSAVKLSGKNVTLKNITINAKGAINFSNDIDMHSLELNFGNKSAVISDSVNLSGSIKATSKRGSLTVPTEFTGSIDYTSTTGDLILGSSGQLTFKSDIGQIKGEDGVLPTINGDAKIETGGSVEIGSISGAGMINTNNAKLTLGEEGKTYNNRFDIKTKFGKVVMNGHYTNIESVITTKYGDIKIESMTNGEVSSSYGDIEIKTANLMKIATGSGDVKIENSDSLVEIATKKGDVDLDKVWNTNITTKSGDVNVENARGDEFTITTDSGDIEFTQGEAYTSKLVITSKKGDVELEGIVGETCVTTNGKVHADIKKVTKPISITGKNKEILVELEAGCYYDLSSKKKIESAPGMTEQGKTYKTTPTSGADETLTIKTNRGKISVIID